VPYSELEVKKYARKIGKSRSTIWLWIKQGCDLRDPKSVREWVTRNTIRETNISKARKRRRDYQQTSRQSEDVTNFRQPSPPTNGSLPPAGKRGTAAALERLEHQEEESYRRLQVALASGSPASIDAAETFWLRCSEVLRRLDLAIEVSRRSEQTMISLSEAESGILAATEWLRVSVMVFLSSEAVPLMGLKNVGEFKSYFIERFRSILALTIMNSLRTKSPVPSWASRRILEAWNVRE
jgi:hypothetical protein